MRTVKKQKSSTSRRVLKGVTIALCILSVLSVTVCISYNMLLDYYVGKMQTEHKEDPSRFATTEIHEDTVTDGSSDSPSDVISTIEEQLANLNGIPPIGDSKNLTNILLIGTDARVKNEPCRSDSMMLVSINTKTKRIVACSLLRDMYVAIEGHTSNRLNAAYSYGGAELLMDTLKKNFNIHVNYYMAVDFFSFIEIVDIMGGIDLEMSASEVRVMNMYLIEINNLLKRPSGTDNLPVKDGTYHLTGAQALGYARNRYIGNGDFARTSRQRTVLNLLAQKAKGASITELFQLLNAIAPKISTNMTDRMIKTLVSNIPTYLTYDIEMTSLPQNNTYSNVTIRQMAVLNVNFKKNTEYLYDLIYGE